MMERQHNFGQVSRGTS